MADFYAYTPNVDIEADRLNGLADRMKAKGSTYARATLVNATYPHGAFPHGIYLEGWRVRPDPEPPFSFPLELAK